MPPPCPPLRLLYRNPGLQTSGRGGAPNNAAELVASISVLRLFEAHTCKVCVVTDSEYVFSGLRGSAEVAVEWVGGFTGTAVQCAAVG